MNFKYSLLSCCLLVTIMSCNTQQSEEKQTQSSFPTFRNWKHYDSPDLSFDYPMDWSLSVDTSMGEVFHISRPEESLPTMFAYDISVTYYNSKKPFTDFVSKEVKSMKEEYGIETLKEEPISFDSKEAVKLLAQFPTDAGSDEPAEIFFVHGSEKYYVIFNAGNAKYNLQADSIIQTIHLE